jgi:hypothetical protein
MKTYRCFIKLFVNEHGTPKQPFDHYDLSSPKQCELIIQHGIKLDRDKILEQFAGEIPKSIMEIEREVSGSDQRNVNNQIYEASRLAKYKKRKESQDIESVEQEYVETDEDEDQEDEEISDEEISDEVFTKKEWRKLQRKILKVKPQFRDKEIGDRKRERLEKNIEIERIIKLGHLSTLMSGSPQFRNKDIKDCEARVYWYLNVESMQEDFEQNDICLTADFVSDFSDYDIVDSLKLVIDESKEALFYEKIFKLLREGEHGVLKIAELVATDELTISHTQVNEMKKLIRLKPFY